MKIAVIHATVQAVAPLNQALQTESADVQVVNFVNEELLRRANERGGSDAAGLRAFLRLAADAAESEPDGIIIACSLYTSYLDWVRQICSVPVIAIDQPMLDLALADGGKIGVIATTAASAPAAVQKLKDAAGNKPFQSETAIVTEAMTALKAGDAPRHHALLREAAEELIRQNCSVLLLSQITMAAAADALADLPARVLSSPQTGAREIIRLIRQNQTAH